MPTAQAHIARLEYVKWPFDILVQTKLNLTRSERLTTFTTSQNQYSMYSVVNISRFNIKVPSDFQAAGFE